MPRPKTFDPEHALDRAVMLFWKQGYEATSLRDLLQTMGISRQSLYDTFGDKHRLFVAALQRYRRINDQLLEELMAPGASLPEIVEHFLRTAELLGNADQCERRACLIANSAAELGARDPEVLAQVRGHLEHLEAILFSCLSTATRRGELADGRNLRSLARFLTNSLAGLGVLAKGGADTAALTDVVDVTLGVLRA